MKKIAAVLMVLLLSALAVFEWDANRENQPQKTPGQVLFHASETSIPNEGQIKSFQTPITAEEYQEMLGVGINVDWMAFAWVNHYYFYWHSKGVSIPQYFKEEGFSNVRIRVGEDVVANRTALRQLGEIVNDTLKAGLIPIITYTAPELRENPTSKSAQEHFVEWWKAVAEYFRDYPHTLSYDLLIESSGPIKNHPEVLNEVYRETIREIREIDPYRLVFVTPPYTSSPFHLDELNVTNDGYILAEWHIYAGGPRGCTYNESYIEDAISSALSWSRKTGIPAWFGAWRPNSYPKKSGRDGVAPLCPMGLELNFTKAMVSALARAGIPYDINADTRFFNIENLTWYEDQREILEIILRPQRRER